MHAPDHSKELDELSRKHIIKTLVLVYDRSYISAEHSSYGCNLLVKTRQLPLYAFAFGRINSLACGRHSPKVAGRYSYKPPHKSGKTLTIKIIGPHILLIRILSKALTPNGTKYYSFESIRMGLLFRDGKGILNIPYKDIFIEDELKFAVHTVDGYSIAKGKDGKLWYLTWGLTRCKGHRTNYLSRAKRWLRISFSSEIIIISD